MFGCQQVLIKLDKETQAILEYLCSESAKLSNCGIYYSRPVIFQNW
jgi:putative transposase